MTDEKWIARNRRRHAAQNLWRRLTGRRPLPYIVWQCTADQFTAAGYALDFNLKEDAYE